MYRIYTLMKTFFNITFKKNRLHQSPSLDEWLWRTPYQHPNSNWHSQHTTRRTKFVYIKYTPGDIVRPREDNNIQHSAHTHFARPACVPLPDSDRKKLHWFLTLPVKIAGDWSPFLYSEFCHRFEIMLYARSRMVVLVMRRTRSIWKATAMLFRCMYIRIGRHRRRCTTRRGVRYVRTDDGCRLFPSPFLMRSSPSICMLYYLYIVYMETGSSNQTRAESAHHIL